jgi:putative flippase GtrA
VRAYQECFNVPLGPAIRTLLGRHEHFVARYLSIGALCAMLNNLILIGADAAGFHYVAAIFLTFVLVLPASYCAHTFWTFNVPFSWIALGRFLMGSLASLAVASVAVWILCGFLLLPMIVSAPLATVTMTVYNFVVTRWAVNGGKSLSRFPAVPGSTV